MQGLKIIGLGSALPGKRVHNDDLAKIMETSDEWIFSRTGIHERRFCEKEESAGTLAIEAGKKALEEAGVPASDLGVILVASMSPDFSSPSIAAILAKELATAEDCIALDINAACSGFVYGLEVVRGLLAFSRKKSTGSWNGTAFPPFENGRPHNFRSLRRRSRCRRGGGKRNRLCFLPGVSRRLFHRGTGLLHRSL